jgi:cytochrome c oxidase assembly protein subunit 15
MNTRQRRAVGVWLFLGALMVYAMIVVGGVTRLTQSGLSMVEWEPLMGVIPPITESDWNETFALYQQYPEYQKTNLGMSLPEFKSIFWWEYAHRVLGRTIGLVFFFPLMFFAIRGYLDRPWVLKLTGLFILGGLQGLMGWYMVMSGLVDDPHVSQYRLVAHLALAVVVYGLMIWYAMDLLRGDVPYRSGGDFMPRYSVSMVLIIFIMILSGGFMAGTRAGFAYNTFPTMNGAWIPSALWALQPGWRNLFENITTIQFVHRSIALIITMAAVWILVLRFYGKALFGGVASDAVKDHYGMNWLLAAVALQVALGIITLLKVVPVDWAALHQAGAVLLFSAALYVAHRVRKIKSSPRPSS